MNRVQNEQTSELPDKGTAGKSNRTGAGGKSQGLAGTTAKLPEENQIPRYSDSPTWE